MKTCKKCGISKPLSEFSKHRTECKDCVKAYNKAYRATRLDDLRAVSREYHAAHRDERLPKLRAYYTANKEAVAAEYKARYATPWGDKIRERNRLSYQKHRNNAKRIESRRKYGMRNRDTETARVAQWRIDNPNAKRIESHNRRQKMRGKLSKGIADRLYAAQKGLCACCGVELKGKYHIDHIMPLALGGANTDDNVQLLTPTCNLRKHAKHPDVYAQEMRKLHKPTLCV